MSIASEITRLQQAKSDLATSIANKGVTVPAATTLDGYAALVDQIQQGGGTLPYDAEIEYLGSSGTQYIDLGETAVSSTDMIIVSFVIPDTPTEQFGIFGARSGASSLNISVTAATTNHVVVDANNSNYSTYRLSSGTSGVVGNVITCYISIALRSIQIGTATKTSGTRTTDSFTANKTSWLFGTNGVANLAKINVKSLMWIRNNRTFMELIPVRKDTTGYMYDKISGQLFGNAGTGSFILGADKN